MRILGQYLILSLTVSMAALEIGHCQSALTTAKSSSGLLAGIQHGQSYVDVNYNRESSKFGISVANSNQLLRHYKIQKPRRGTTFIGLSQEITKDKTFPNFLSYETSIGVNTTDGKASLFAKNEVLSDLFALQTFAFVIDKTPTAGHLSAITTEVWTCDGVANKYLTKEDCEKKGGCAECNSSTRTDYEFDRQDDIQTHALFVRVGVNHERRNFLSSKTITTDSTTSIVYSLADSSVMKYRVVLGYNYLQQLCKSWFLTIGPSFQIEHIPSSYNSLTKRELQKVKGTIVDDMGNVFQDVESSKTYYDGNRSKETILYPRLDILLRTKLIAETDKMPYLGLLYSLSPSISTIDKIGVKWNTAIGITVHPPFLPDQVVFALMAEWSDFASDKKDHKPFSVNFHAGVPFKFK